VQAQFIHVTKLISMEDILLLHRDELYYYMDTFRLQIFYNSSVYIASDIPRPLIPLYLYFYICLIMYVCMYMCVCV